MSDEVSAWIKWFPRDWLTSKARLFELSPMGRLAYRELLDLCWLTDRCGLERDLVKLAQLTMTPQEAVEEALGQFEIHPDFDELMTHPRLLAEHRKALQRVDAGRKGGLAKARRGKVDSDTATNQAESDTVDVANRAESDTDDANSADSGSGKSPKKRNPVENPSGKASESGSETGSETTGKTLGTQDSGLRTHISGTQDSGLKTDSSADADARVPKAGSFDLFWDLVWDRVGKAAARRAFMRLKAEDRHKAIEMAPLHGRLYSKHRVPARFRPHPSTWLNQGRFEDDLRDLDKSLASRGGGGMTAGESTAAASRQLLEED